ncbi:hypothetical protein UA08_08259 [Talaromyces atroroseus]|uniref:Telomere-associated protein Rif1 N-terminal domain-containing protein n=1 Tax=Talaromyces atroroseus TaxID=1441469 RepID=A0A225AHI8_TALAT|nr:hypothetical protein UA08_08259 [Talaromyces atroroseus]OKL56528.1 hypothetical protein UA08_08259 [Talaromyces atroroseus]
MVEVFTARPPTPPKASHGLLKRDGEPLPGRSNMLGTPGESPASTAESRVLRSNKKVNFSPITSYIKPPSFSNHTSISAPEIRSLPPSNECKPTKSILKATSTTLLTGDMALTEESQPQSFAILLDSATQQLGGESLSSRVDAYMQLLGALKAYENIPEQDALASKLVSLLQSVQRDITRDLGKGDLVEMNLVINALKLGLYIIWSDDLASQIPDDFKIFIIDQSLSVLQEGKLPKSILNHYIHILYTQNFSQKTMTNSRVTRILAVLNDITDRVNGNGIVSHRLVVYTRLLSQSKSVMASQASLWVENFISGLLHPVKDTRSKALILGNKVALLLGPNMNISKCILDIFNKELSQGRKLVSEICERMSRMMMSVESGVHVPQIWSIIILLLRSKRFNIEHWEYFKEWVLVLQKCFNCSEPAIKSQAIIGWNKFVYVVSCNESTSMSMLKMLTKPILSQPERKRNEKGSSHITPLFLSSYYNLIYYTFRPSTPYEHIDFLWEEYISQPFANKFANSPQLNDAACKALSSLLWTPQPKVWTENKINEVSRMESEYIVPIDCRWIRSRIVVVVHAFEVLLASSTWKSGNVSDSNIALAWTHICKALGDASSKEIKPSTELMQAIATILGLFQRLVLAGPSSLNAKTNEIFLERFSYLSTTLISTVGPSPFTENLLLKTSQETFQAANTPTHRRSNAGANLETSFMHILRMLSSFGKLSEPSQKFLGVIDNLLEVASKGRQSRSSRLDFLEKCTEISLNEGDRNETTPPLDSYIWESTARLTINCLASLPMETLRDRDGTLSRDYGNMTSILVRGLQFATASITWNSLLDVYVRIIRIERGECGILTLVIEPIADKLIQLDRKRIYQPLKALVNQASSLAYYQQIKFPPTSTVSNRGGSVFLPDKLLELLEKLVAEAYDQYNASESSVLADVVESLTSLLGSGALQFRSILLEKLQGPLALWLRDSAHCLTAENGADSRLLTACRTLALAVANILQMAIPHNTDSLLTFEAVISAGLESVHKSTANRFIDMWNATFGLQESVSYPPGVQTALQKLIRLVELQLPSPLPSQVGSQELEMPDFVESQDTGVSESILNPIRRDFKHVNNRLSRPTNFSSSPIIQSTEWSNSHTSTKQTADSSHRRGRLRHEDSQIQFVAVDSSPRSSDIESQLLTEHQREVKERQHGNPSMFLEGLRSSSPALPYPAEDTGILSPTQLPKMRSTVRDAEAPGTPILANLQDNDDDFPGSSPTPGTKEQIFLQAQGGSALSINSLDTVQSDPPSSPPEIAPSRSSRNKRVARQKSLPRKSESKMPRDVEINAEESSEEPRSAGMSTKDGTEHLVIDAKLSENQTDMSHKEHDPHVQDVPDADSAPTDVMPDTDTDEFEQQLASQLEQDLELAVDLKIWNGSQSAQSPDKDLQSGPVTRKRKRDAETEEASTPGRTKRRSRRRSKAVRRKSAQEESSQSENDTSEPATPQASIPKRGLSTPQSSPLKHHVSVDDLSDNATDSSSKRETRHASPEVLPSPIKAKSSGSHKRRSLRLSGVTAISPPKSNEMPGASKNNKKRSQNNSNHAKKNNSGSPEKARKDDLVHDVAMANNDNDAGAQITSTTSDAMDIVVPETTEKDSTDKAQNLVGQEGQDIGTGVVMATEESHMETADAPLVTPEQEKPFTTYVSQTVQTEDRTEDGDHNMRVLESLRRVLSDIKNATFGREFLREMDDVMFDIRVEAHEAARRSDA